MNRNAKWILIGCLIIVFFVFTGEELMSQCPMCRISAESNLKDGGTQGKGLNKGILFMLTLPYLLVGTLGYIWWKNKRKFTEEIMTESFSDN